MTADVAEVEKWLERLSAAGATVTIVRRDGKTVTGTLHAHPTEPHAYRVRTGRRGRPATVWPIDVEEVTAE